MCRLFVYIIPCVGCNLFIFVFGLQKKNIFYTEHKKFAAPPPLPSFVSTINRNYEHGHQRTYTRKPMVEWRWRWKTEKLWIDSIIPWVTRNFEWVNVTRRFFWSAEIVIESGINWWTERLFIVIQLILFWACVQKINRRFHWWDAR